MNDFQIPDEQLVNKVVLDEHFEAFGELYDRYHQKIFNKCLLFVDSEEDAENYTHDIFLKAFLNLRDFNRSTKFITWLNSIAYKMCFNYASTNGSHQEYRQIEEERIKVLHCDSEKRLLKLEVDELKKVLKKLPPEDRLMLLMRYQDGMDPLSIHHELRISEDSVIRRLDRARERAMAIYDNLINQYETYGQPRITKSVSTA